MKDRETGKNTGTVRGTRCSICTGCGRCPGVGNGMRILMELQPEDVQPIPGGRGERLVTADIGTTTVAMQLYGTDGAVVDSYAAVNPQTAYGADVVSRIQAAEAPEAADEMRDMIQGTLEKGISRFLGELEEGETLRMVLAANTTMVYLLMGWNTAELGKAPFHASHLEAAQIRIAGVPCHIFPGLSAFVGGDITAGILSCGMAEKEELTLLIDLGTNGEMALGNCRSLIACSTAAGPAFEGGVNRGVWGADMVSLLARLRREGILDETGLLRDPWFDKGIRIGGVCVTQESVRAVQLAKGAIAAGIRILAREYGVLLTQIDRVVLAGGFGYYLDPEAAADIGLLPRELLGRTVTGGNTALAGALRLGRRLLTGEETVAGLAGEETVAGLSGEEALRLLPGAERCHVRTLNLAEAEGFQDLFLSAMGF